MLCLTGPAMELEQEVPDCEAVYLTFSTNVACSQYSHIV